jgi:hypothetical protein
MLVNAGGFQTETLPKKAAAGTRAGRIKFTSRILEGLMARRGLVERREGIGCAEG